MRLQWWLTAGVAAFCHAQTTPLHVIVTPPRAASISILSVHFQEVRFGHEGPGFFPVEHAPYRGKPAVVEVHLFGQDAIRSVQFELVDQFGLQLAKPVAIRVGSGADADEYLLQLEVPLQPFRFGIRGEDFRGQAFERFDKRLYVPIEGSTPQPALPPGLPAAEVSAFERMRTGFVAQVEGQFGAARQAHPDGVIRLGRAEVLEAEYEPLVSPGGHEIGVRLRLAVRFGAEGDYAVTPSFYSEYKTADWRQISLKVLDGAVSPSPASTAADTLEDVLRYGGAAHYREGQIYRFQFEAVPSFMLPNVTRTRFCVNSAYYRAARPEVWEAVQDSTAPVKYRVSISSLDFEAETGDLPPQRTYLESFRRDGAGDCGPTPTNRF